MDNNVAISETALKEKCILIYDDNPEILFLCKNLLARDNYRVETLTRCDNVISDVDRIKPDLILMDLWIPDIGGEKAITLLKENATHKEIPVLLFSANASLAQICEKINADGYIEKPFDITDFSKKIENYIKR